MAVCDAMSTLIAVLHDNIHADDISGVDDSPEGDTDPVQGFAG